MVESYKKKPKEFYLERRKRRYDYPLPSHYSSLDPSIFRGLGVELNHNREQDFNNYLSIQFPRYQKNIRFVQECSGLNKREFSLLANISDQAFRQKQAGSPTTIPIHTFIKSYSIMRYFLPMIEFCDMFMIDFSEVYPWLKQQEQANRLKLGKDKRKTYTFKKK